METIDKSNTFKIVEKYWQGWYFKNPIILGKLNIGDDFAYKKYGYWIAAEVVEILVKDNHLYYRCMEDSGLFNVLPCHFLVHQSS
ncbi:MAG: hypothetical protein WBB28_09395 [Crinalium sp.]